MVKQEVINLISRLPENATLEDIMYELYVLQKHKKAMAAIENGDILTVDEVKGLLLKQQ
jgi:phosphohistidine swiveling domain-containing protein